MSNKAAHTLSHHPLVPNEEDSVTESEEYETISYAKVCDALKTSLMVRNSS